MKDLHLFVHVVIKSRVIWWRYVEDWEEKFKRRIPQPRAALGVVSKLPAAFPSPKLNRSFRVYHISFYWMNIQVDPTSSNVASAMLNSKIRPRAVVGYGVKIFHPSRPNYVTRSPGEIGDFTSSFGRLRQIIVLKWLPLFSFNQSAHCFLPSSLP